MASQSFTVDLTKTTGTVLSASTTSLTVHADSDAAARRMAIEMLNDDQGDIVWTALAPTSTPTGDVQINSVMNNATKVVTK